MRTSLYRITLAMGLALLTALTIASQANAAGIPNPQLAELVATLLPSCVNVTTTRYKEIQIVNGKSIMVQDPDPDRLADWRLGCPWQRQKSPLPAASDRYCIWCAGLA